MSLVIGIDAGGTKLAAGVVDPDEGHLVWRDEVASRRERGAAAVLADCVALARRACAAHDVVAIGLGVPELVSLEGAIASAANWDWRDDSFRAALAAVAPLWVESDVRAAATAEARFGAGRGVPSFLYMSIGTGVSHCLVIGGAPWRGARGNAIVTGAPLVELSASGSALETGAGVDSAKLVVGSEAHEPLVRAAAAGLGTELARLVNALDPGVVVIGGGLGLAAGFRDMMAAEMRPLIYADATREIELRPAALGADAGVIGAALAAADRL